MSERSECDCWRRCNLVHLGISLLVTFCLTLPIAPPHSMRVARTKESVGENAIVAVEHNTFPFRVGDIVTLHNLSGKPALNSRKARVIGPPHGSRYPLALLVKSFYGWEEDPDERYIGVTSAKMKLEHEWIVDTVRIGTSSNGMNTSMTPFVVAHQSLKKHNLSAPARESTSMLTITDPVRSCVYTVTLNTTTSGNVEAVFDASVLATDSHDDGEAHCEKENHILEIAGNGNEKTEIEPHYLAVSNNGRRFLADKRRHQILELDSTGFVTIAGKSKSAHRDGPLSSSAFRDVRGLAVAPNGILYALDGQPTVIREIHLSEDRVTTMAIRNNKTFADFQKLPPPKEGVDRKPRYKRSEFPHAKALSCDGEGNLFFTSTWENHVVWKVTGEGHAEVYAGKGPPGYRDGSFSLALFSSPHGILVTDGSVYVADTFNNCIRKISPDRMVTTVAGTGKAGHRDGSTAKATFKLPYGLAISSSGKSIYVADPLNSSIRRLSLDSRILESVS